MTRIFLSIFGHGKMCVCTFLCVVIGISMYLSSEYCIESTSSVYQWSSNAPIACFRQIRKRKFFLYPVQTTRTHNNEKKVKTEDQREKNKYTEFDDINGNISERQQGNRVETLFDLYIINDSLCGVHADSWGWDRDDVICWNCICDLRGRSKATATWPLTQKCVRLATKTNTHTHTRTHRQTVCVFVCILLYARPTNHRHNRQLKVCDLFFSNDKEIISLKECVINRFVVVVVIFRSSIYFAHLIEYFVRCCVGTRITRWAPFFSISVSLSIALCHRKKTTKRTKWNQIKCKPKTKNNMLKMSRKTTEIDFCPESLDIVNYEVTRLLIIIISHSIYQRRLVFFWDVNVAVHRSGNCSLLRNIFFLFLLSFIYQCIRPLQ